MDLERLPLDGEVVLAGEAVDTRLANKAEGSYEVGVDGYTRRHEGSVSLAR
jgi:hypothetical protein